MSNKKSSSGLGRVAWIILWLNTLRPRQHGHHFADDSLRCIFLNWNSCILNKISLKYIPFSLIDNMRALVQIMAWRRTSDKPLSEAMKYVLLAHMCVTRPQWVKIVMETANVIVLIVLLVTKQHKGFVVRQLMMCASGLTVPRQLPNCCSELKTIVFVLSYGAWYSPGLAGWVAPLS